MPTFCWAWVYPKRTRFPKALPPGGAELTGVQWLIPGVMGGLRGSQQGADSIPWESFSEGEPSAGPQTRKGEERDLWAGASPQNSLLCFSKRPEETDLVRRKMPAR